MQKSYKTRVNIDIEATVGTAVIEWGIEIKDDSSGIEGFDIVVPSQEITVHFYDEDMKPRVVPFELSSNNVVVYVSDQQEIRPKSLDLRTRPFQLYLK